MNWHWYGVYGDNRNYRVRAVDRGNDFLVIVQIERQGRCIEGEWVFPEPPWEFHNSFRLPIKWQDERYVARIPQSFPSQVSLREAIQDAMDPVMPVQFV